MKLYLLFCIQFISFSSIFGETVYDVTKYGADNTGKSKITDAVKKAMDAAVKGGGGTVYFPAGHYLSTSINIKSNVLLHFADGVTVTFSYEPSDYPKLTTDGQTVDHTPLIYAFGEKNIGVKGKVTFDGQGSHWWDKFYSDTELKITPYEVTLKRPPTMHFFDCKGITLQDFTIKNSPFWNVNPVQCEDITIKGITIDNPYNSQNTDGINCYSCKNLHIDSVTISTGDDCVALDAGSSHPTQGVVISNSHMKLGHSGVGIGSAVSGGLSNISVSNCVFEGTDRGLYIKSMRGRGGTVQNIKYSSITMNSIKKEGIVLSMLYDADHQDAALHNTTGIKKETFSSTTPVFKDIDYSGVKGSSSKNPIYFVGLPESLISDIKLTNVEVKSSEKMFLLNTKGVTIDGKEQKDTGF